RLTIAPSRRRAQSSETRPARAFDETIGGTHAQVALARRFKLRVRERSALHLYGERGLASRTAGQEVVLSETEAAAVLRGTGRRVVELVEVIDSSAAARKRLPG